LPVAAPIYIGAGKNGKVGKTIFPPLIFPVLKKWKNWTVFQSIAHFLQLQGGKNVAVFSIFASPTGKINFAPFFPPKAPPIFEPEYRL
jgi:hypothetical protein